MVEKLRERYNSWIKELNKFELAYFESEYIAMGGDNLDYSDMDIWLFERWVDKNG